MLHDDAKLKITGFNPFGGIPTSPGEESAKTLGKIGTEVVKPLVVECHGG
jgi:pyrrolidone-carboxylate peptidase